jgi:hypothetical protein
VASLDIFRLAAHQFGGLFYWQNTRSMMQQQPQPLPNEAVFLCPEKA